MHFHRNRILTSGIAALLSALMLSAPAAAIAEETEPVEDRNGDGVIDVFDYVLHKRASVEENCPIDIALQDTAAAPGGLAVISAEISNNPGFETAKFTLAHDEALTPAQLTATNTCILPSDTLYQGQELKVTPLDINSTVFCYSKRVSYTEDNGEWFEIYFRLPEDAEIGTVYQVEFREIELVNEGRRLPLLTKRGNITVVPAEEISDLSPEEAVKKETTTTESESAVTTEATTAATTKKSKTTTAATDTESEVSATTKATKKTTAKTTVKPTETVTETTAETEAQPEEPELPVTEPPAEETEPAVTEPPAEETQPAVQTTYCVSGIDVSVYQGVVDYQKVKAESNNQFVMMRAGFGRHLDQEDLMFRANYNGAKAAGLPVGAYWYSYADTPAAARIEANVCAQVLGDRQFEYPIVYDVEEPWVLNDMDPAAIGAIIDAFCSEMEKKGYYVMLYCSTFYLNNRIPAYITQRYDTWLAEWNVPQPTYGRHYNIWQYGIGTCPGVEGDVDVNLGYRDFPALMKEKHLNGY